MRKGKYFILALIALVYGAGFSLTQAATSAPATATSDAEEELAKKLANPVASLISVPLQYNYDENYGVSEKGSKSVLNTQPVAPFSLHEDWNVITRTIIPLVNTDDLPIGSS